MNQAGELAFVDSIPSRPDPETFVNRLCDLVSQTMDAAQTEPARLAGIGVAIAGFLDPTRDHLVYNSNLAWLENYSLRSRLSDRFRMPVELEVDSNAAAMAEWWFGSGRGSHRFLCIASGTGLGVGMVIDGAPLRFAYGCLGDIGHIIVERGGPLCTCGGYGCAEIMVSAPAVAERFRERAGLANPATLRDVIEAARAQNPIAISLLQETGEWLGIATASLASTFFPDHIAIAGGLSEAGDLVMNAVERSFATHAGTFPRSQTTLARATLGSRATLVGAAWPFLQRNARE